MNHHSFWSIKVQKHCEIFKSGHEIAKDIQWWGIYIKVILWQEDKWNQYKMCPQSSKLLYALKQKPSSDDIYVYIYIFF